MQGFVKSVPVFMRFRRGRMYTVVIIDLLVRSLSLTLVATALGTFAQTDPCATTKEHVCASRAGCLWVIETGTGSCRSSPYCSPTWSQQECENVYNSGACAFENGGCTLKAIPDSTINVGRTCLSACSDSTGTYNGNSQCSFCGTEGFCCHVNYPNGCLLDYSVVDPSISELYCAVPAPRSFCVDRANEGECNKYAVDGCFWYGSEDRCQSAPYCNDQWSQSQCTRPENSGACLWDGLACRRRPVPLSTVNIGMDCTKPCEDQTEANPTFNTQCSFCGTEGICCDPSNPVGCLPDTSLCAGKEACCAVPGSWAPTKSPSTLSPTKSPTSSIPTASPSRSPTTSTPTLSPTGLPTASPSTSAPSKTPSIAPSTLSPTSSAPTLTPTRSPSIFGSVVEFASTTGKYEPDVHGSQAFFDHICNIFTTYWFPSLSECDTGRITITIEPHEGSAIADVTRRRRLDTAPRESNVDVRFSMALVPENASAVDIGHVESNRELRRRAASAQFKIMFGDPPAITQTDAPASSSASNSEITATSMMYIGIGVGCFGLFVLLAVILVIRQRKNTQSDQPYPPSESYRRRDIYVPPKNDNVFIVGADEFRTVPPMTQRDYVAEEAGGVFTVSPREVAVDPNRARTSQSGLAPFSGSMEQSSSAAPQKTKSFHRTMSLRSDRSDDRRPISRKDSRRSAGSARSGNDSEPPESRSRENTLYRHQMAPYFSGRNSLDGDELETNAMMPTPPPLRQSLPRPTPRSSNPQTQSAPSSHPQIQSAPARTARDGEIVAYTSGRNGMSDWI